MRRKLWLPVLLVLCLALTVGMLVACDPGSSDQGGQGGNGGENAGSAGLIFEDIGGSYSVTGYAGTGGEVVIPETHNGLPVTSIGDYAFEDCASLTSITIPDSVTSIGGRVFYGCKSLESMTIPFVGATKEGTGYTHFGYIFGAWSYSDNCDYVPTSLKEVIITGGTSIGYRAFEDCTSLTSVTIPDSVTSIGDYAFLDCTSLTSIAIPDSVTNIGEWAFGYCTSLEAVHIADIVKWLAIDFGNSYANPLVNGVALYLDGEPVTDFVIPNSVTSIGRYAFEGCTSLTSITIPDSVTSIGGAAFRGCSSLTSITIPNSVTSIGGSAFSGCSSLESMTIPFVGAEADKTAEDTYQYPFGYIFGTSSYTGGTAVKQYYYGSSISSTTSATYYIPSSLRSVTVTGGNIPYGAFYNCSTLTSVTIGNSVTTIGEDALYNCTSLTSVTIPDSVTSVGDYAFYNCNSLAAVYITDIGKWVATEFGDSYANPLYYAGNLYLNGELVTDLVIPDSVTSIGQYAFYGCDSFTSVAIPDGVTSIGRYAFRNCKAEIIWGGTPTITQIGEYAFAYYDGTSITIPDSVTSIGEDAFWGCTSLTSITIPDSVTSIGRYAFSYCDSLTSVTIPDSVTSIEGYAFDGCTGLTSIHYTGDMASWLEKNWHGLVMSSGRALYIGGTKIEGELVIPNRIASIPSYAFAYQTAITSVTIPDSVTSIEDWAFYGCDSLTSVTIPDSVTSIGSYAFRNCTALESITIPFVGATKDGTSNTHFGYIFGASSYSDNGNYVPSSLKEVIITGGTSIGSYVFRGCSSLTSVTIPDSVTSIGRYAFQNCTSLTSITIPNSVTNIGGYAFYGCDSLASVTIGNSVTSIGEGAFAECNSLEHITLPFVGEKKDGTGETRFGYIFETFDYSDNRYVPESLKSVVITGGASIGGDAFWSCTSLTSITIPNSVTSIGYRAFRNCTSLTSIIIPSSVRSIGYYAFYGCDSLASITFKGSVASIGHNAFDGCDALEIVDIASIPGWAGIEFEDETANPLSNGSALYLSGELVLDLVFPVSVATIKQYAFYNCSSITSVTLTHNMRTIGDQAFYGCDKLVEVYNNSQLDIVVGYRYGYVGYYAMNITQSSTQSWFTDTDDGYRFIYDATNDSGYLVGYYGDETELTLPDSFMAYNGKKVTEYEIYDSAFRGCRSLTSITIPDSVTSIGYEAFYGCTSLTSVTIGNGVTSIGRSAFRGCTSLTSITIPDGVTSIGQYAFYDCTSLASVIFEETTRWYRGLIGDTSTSDSLSSSSLADPSTAAQWLTSKYNQFDWYRK